MKTLCKLVGGSRLYGLNTPESDTDIRSVFMHDDIARTIGLDRFEHEGSQSAELDTQGYELRRFLNLLRKTNTQVLEILYAPGYIELDPDFKKLVVDERNKLIETKQLFRTLMGYIQGEKALMTGERTGTLGKRKEAIEKYGYSYKNAVQLLRLGFCGQYMFSTGTYPVVVCHHNKELHDYLFDVKTHPENHTKEELVQKAAESEQALKLAFDSRDVSRDLHFDEGYANWVLLRMYSPVIRKLVIDSPSYEFKYVYL